MHVWSAERSGLLSRRMISHLRKPLYRNGYALTFSSLFTSGIGVAYWIVAARSYPVASVGLNSAALSAMMFLAGLAQLNLMSALIRFIPQAGRATRALIIYAYVISLAVALLVSTVFLVGLGLWAPALGFLRAEPWLAAWFVLGTLAWCIFVLQDSVLTGLRQATWVPAENAVFALVKIVLLAVFARIFSAYGVFASWTLALLASLVPTNLLIFRVLLPRRMREVERQDDALTFAQVARFVAPDYIGALCWMLCTTLLPVIVNQVAGATANGYFYLAWTIAYALYMVSPNMGSSLIVEAAGDQRRLAEYSRQVFNSTMRLLLPAVAVLVAAAPFVLRLFGQAYAAESTLLLRLLALSALPNVINAQFVSVARVQRRMMAIVSSLAVLCMTVLGLSYVLLPRLGITGVGAAWLTSQTVMSVVLWAAYLRPLWSGRAQEAARTPRQPEGVLARFGATEPARLVRSAVGLYNRAVRFRRFSPQVTQILADLPPVASEPGPRQWTARSVVATVTDRVVAKVGPAGGEACAMLKVPASAQGMASLARESANLQDLLADGRLDGWRSLLPDYLYTGSVAGQPYVIERLLPGVEGRLAVSRDGGRALAGLAGAAIGELHSRTTRSMVVDDSWLAEWVDRPVRTLDALAAGGGPTGFARRPLRELSGELRGGLRGRTLAVSWIHGDFVPSNVLIAPDGSRVTGIIDWELARPDGLPLLDLVQFLVATRMIVERRELGSVVRGLLTAPAWLPFEQTLLDQAQARLPGEALPLRTLLLLCWLGHISANLGKASRYATHGYWVAHNISNVIEYLL